MVTTDLHNLIDRIKDYVMSQEEKEAQRRSFVYGNLRISNSNVTRELVDSVADKNIAMPKLHYIYCDNCGRKHLGYMEKWGAGFETPKEYNFIWTDRKGKRKKELPC